MGLCELSIATRSGLQSQPCSMREMVGKKNHRRVQMQLLVLEVFQIHHQISLNKLHAKFQLAYQPTKAANILTCFLDPSFAKDEQELMRLNLERQQKLYQFWLIQIFVVDIRTNLNTFKPHFHTTL